MYDNFGRARKENERGKKTKIKGKIKEKIICEKIKAKQQKNGKATKEVNESIFM